METENIENSLYVDTFITERPRNGIDTPHARLLSALKLNDELAEYFSYRAQIEDIYAKSLAKLTKKNYISNKAALGTFLPLWEMLQVELSRASSLHSEYSASIIENIEQPLRSCIPSNRDYNDIQKMDEHIQKMAREYDELDLRIQKHKKSAKGEAKAVEYTKQQEQKLAEWKQNAPYYFQKHQLIDENRWNTIKSTIELFETLQQSHANAIIEMTGNTVMAASNLQVNNEIAAFCASYTPHPIVDANATHAAPVTPASPPLQSQQQHEAELISLDNVVPEPSVSDMSLKQTNAAPPPPPPVPAVPSVKKEKKRFFSSLVSMRRKPKSETNHTSDLSVPTEHQQNGAGNRLRSFSNAGSFVESASLHSINTHSTVDHSNEMAKSPSSNHFGSIEVTSPSSPTSLDPPSLRKAPSFNGSITSALSSQPSQPAPLILVDAEGFSIPPPDRTAWALDSINNTSDSLLELDETGSDAGSLFSNPRIRVDIKSEATQEDASQSVVALNRVSTLLKEKNSVPTARKLRGRREMRATQLYSVIEQDQMLPKVENQLPATAPVSSPFANPFELSQEKIVEEEEQQQPEPINNNLPQIDVHIAETIHVLSRAGEAEKSAIWGEVSLSYKGPAESVTPVCFQINRPTKLDKVNATEYAEILDGYDHDTFKLNTHLFKTDEPVVVITYQVKLAKEHIPLSVRPMWKCDQDKSRLLVKYHKHHDLPPLENVMFVTSITGDVQNALSIPAGELLLSQKRIKWHLGQIADNEEAVIKAQFTTLEQATPQPIAIRFEMKDRLMSDVNVEYGTDALVIWAKINNMFKSVKVGKYIAEV